MPRPDSSGKRSRATAVAQGAYYLATGLWPFVSMRSFLAVTGPKADLWLVRTVGGLVGVVGGVLLAAGRRERVTPEIRWLGAGSAAALGLIESYYALKGRISPVYLADAVAEAGIVGAWARAEPDGTAE